MSHLCHPSFDLAGFPFDGRANCVIVECALIPQQGWQDLSNRR
jgi:hypothetical protein